MQEVFGSMGFDEKVSEKTFSTVEHYICTVHGKSKLRWPLGLRKLRSSEKVEILQMGLILRIA